jgi:hypothetical protein
LSSLSVSGLSIISTTETRKVIDVAELVGEDTDWIEDFMMLQSYVADLEKGREPSILVMSYIKQNSAKKSF